MPATTDSLASMPPLQRRMAEAWLTRFDENWHAQKLRECMRSLPNHSSMRRPLLLAMIERDLAHTWNAGRSASLENYLHQFPEIGGIDEIPIELIASEFKLRQQNNCADLSEFAERFPTRIDELYVLLKPAGFSTDPSASDTKEEAVAPSPPADDQADPISMRRLQLLRATAADPPETLIESPTVRSEDQSAEVDEPSEPPPATLQEAESLDRFQETSESPPLLVQTPLKPESLPVEVQASLDPPLQEPESLDQFQQTSESPPLLIQTPLGPESLSADIHAPPELSPVAPPTKLDLSPPPVASGPFDLEPARPSKQGRLSSSRFERSLPPMPPRTLGRYSIEKRLGSSGRGTTYLATDTLLDRRVVLNIPQIVGADADLTRAHFRREARLAAGLCHPLLCPVMDVDRIDNIDVLVMPFVEGDTLTEALKQRAIWPAHQAIDLVLKLGAALDAAHRRGAVHRNLKPSNILMTPSELPVIVGFGQLSAAPRNGGAGYVAPELAAGEAELTSPRSDIYSLGAVLSQLLSGVPPAAGKDAGKTFPPDLDRRLQTICLKATAANPDERYASMRDLMAELSSCRQSNRASEGEIRLPPAAPVARRAPGSAPGRTMPAGLSPVPAIAGAPGLSAVLEVTSQPSGSSHLAPEVRNALSQSQKPRPPAGKSSAAVPLAPKPIAGRLKGAKWLVAGAVIGLVIVGTYFILTGGKKQSANASQNQPLELSAAQLQELKTELYSASLEARNAAIEKVKGLKESDAVDLLVHFVAEAAWVDGDSKGEDRTAALSAIRSIAPGSESLAAALKQATKAKDVRVRIWACGPLAVLSDSEYKDQLLPLLLAALKDTNPDLRKAAAEQIHKNRLGDEAVVGALVNRISDGLWEPTRLRRVDKDGGKTAAAEALHAVAPKRLGPALHAASRAVNPEIKRWAEEMKNKYGLD
jgi:serine/threonine protein kinase